ncbi:MAG TPA: hypothetical protein VGZ52_10295 [Acidimicrobiales bacterium]|jgi:lincosamide nucleotidyltransferase A/C/D/E|nr:hypothetical protein [Acidimicrobiales bacterium]
MRVADRARRWGLGTIRSSDLLVVLATVEAVGVVCTLAGGWAVDALDGEMRRAHADVDIIIDDYEVAVDLACAALAPLGFRKVEKLHAPGVWMPQSLLLDDGGGHRVDLVSIDWSLVSSALGVDEDTAKERAITSGTIDGRTVACLSAPVQLLFHAGYPPRRSDEFDIDVLLRHLVEPLPFHGDGGRARQAATSVLETLARRSGTDVRIAMRDSAASLPRWLGDVEA